MTLPVPVPDRARPVPVAGRRGRSPRQAGAETAAEERRLLIIQDSSETNRLSQRVSQGDDAARSALLIRHEARLRRLIAFRLDPRLKGRIDPADVLQDVFLTASQNLAAYLRQPPMPFFLWLRGIAVNRLLELHRHHLGTPMRDARREVSIHRGPLPEATSAALAAQLLGKLTSPSAAAIRMEARLRILEALDALEPIDREILVLRHLEQLSSDEAAEVLKIKERAASKRHLRALQRLRAMMAAEPGGEGNDD